MHLIEAWEDECELLGSFDFRYNTVRPIPNNSLLLVKPLPFAKRNIHWEYFGIPKYNYFIHRDFSHGNIFIRLGEMLDKEIPYFQYPYDPFLPDISQVFLTDDDLFSLRLICD